MVEVGEEAGLVEKTGMAEEMMEELRRRLAHEAMGPPPVCRVRTLIPVTGGPAMAPAGTIMVVHRLSEVEPDRMGVTLDGKEWTLPLRHGGLPTVEILD